MMTEEKIRELLNGLADATAELVRPGLAEDIKHQIPSKIVPHRGGMDTIRILIDLRISKLAAAAAIIITIILCATFFGGRDLTADGLYLIKGWLGWGGDTDVPIAASEYENLIGQGKVVYYLDNVDPKDSETILVHWKLSDDKYRVMFADFSTKIVGADELIKLQARMLQKRTK